MHEGTVAFADPFTGYGNLVIIDHGDGAYSLYGHLGAIDVARGDRVEAQRAASAPRAATPAATPRCTSSYASTASRSIPYNG